MCEFIIGKPEIGFDIDHWDRDIFNNQRLNLRVCTKSQNSYNKISFKNSSSEYKGVCYLAKRNKYVANIGVEKRHIYLGIFKSETEAAIAYGNAAKELHGEFACLNFPNGIDINFIENLEHYRKYWKISQESIINSKNYIKQLKRTRNI